MSYITESVARLRRVAAGDKLWDICRPLLAVGPDTDFFREWLRKQDALNDWQKNELGWAQMEVDRENVADAYLAELDPAPITPEILRELGFVPYAGDWVRAEVFVRKVPNGWNFGNGRFCGYGITTLGQLRTLLRLAEGRP